MSNRFYVNEVQIFGNNEMFNHTYEELKRQGANWTEDGTFREINISDPNGLMRAVELDVFELLKKSATEDVFDRVNKKFIKRKDFSDVHDKDLFFSSYEDDLKIRLYEENGDITKDTWRILGWWISENRVFTPYVLYQAMKKSVEYKDGKLCRKDGCHIKACMY